MGLLDPTALPPGQLPGGYSWLELQNNPRCGGQGVVYPAWDVRTRKTVALKFYRRSQGFRPDDLLSQLDYCRRLPDESFSRIYDLVDLRQSETWELFGFTMDYLDWSFQDLLKEAKQKGWKFPAKTIERWIRELAAAISRLQEDGKVHRDLKPDNIGFRLGRTIGGLSDLLPGQFLPRSGANLEDFEGARLIVTDLGTLANVGQESGSIQPKDRYKHPDFYPKSGQIPSAGMDLYAFGMLLEDFRSLSEEPLAWLHDAGTLCLDVRNPIQVGVLPLLVSPTWKSQTKLYRDAGFDTQGLEKFEGRKWVFDAFDEFANLERHKTRGGVFLIVGPAGCGKSTLLREWSRRRAQHQGFYFKVKVRTTALNMVESIGNQLAELLIALEDKGRAIVDQDEQLRNIKNYPPEQRLQVWIDRVFAHPKAPKQLYVFVDAIDETDTAHDAEAVIRSLPKRLPPGYFLIVSSRPALPDWDYLKQLKDSYAAPDSSFHELPIDLQSPGNKEDVQKSLAKELSRPVHDPQIQNLANHCGYLFLLASFQAEAIRHGQLTIEEALKDSVDWLKIAPEDRLSAYYQSSWDRIMGVRGGDASQRGKLADFLVGITSDMVVEYVQAMMAVLGNYGIDEQSLYRWLGPTGNWKASRVRNLNQLFLWFVEPVGDVAEDENPSYRVRHKSIRDFLTSGKGPIPPADVRIWHGRIAGHYLTQAGYSATAASWVKVEPYGKRNVVQHLLESLEIILGTAGHFHNTEAWQTAATILTSWDYLGVCLNDSNQWV